MTLSSAPLAYAPEYEALDAALSDPGRGVRVPFPTYAAASHFRHRLHKARSVDRKRATDGLVAGDPGFGVTAYDTLVCKIRQSVDGTRFFVFIEKNDVSSQFESIPEDEETIEGLPPRQKFESLPANPSVQIPFIRRKL